MARKEGGGRIFVDWMKRSLVCLLLGKGEGWVAELKTAVGDAGECMPCVQENGGGV